MMRSLPFAGGYGRTQYLYPPVSGIHSKVVLVCSLPVIPDKPGFAAQSWCASRCPSGNVTAGKYPLPHFWLRSEEHTSELQSLMRISYAVFCLKKKKPP